MSRTVFVLRAHVTGWSSLPAPPLSDSLNVVAVRRWLDLGGRFRVPRTKGRGADPSHVRRECQPERLDPAQACQHHLQQAGYEHHQGQKQNVRHREGKRNGLGNGLLVCMQVVYIGGTVYLPIGLFDGRVYIDVLFSSSAGRLCSREKSPISNENIALVCILPRVSLLA